MLRVTRSLHTLRSSLQPSIRAGPSSIPARPPKADRYLAIHSFFTRQASLLARPSTPFARPSSQTRITRFPPFHRFNSSSHRGKPSLRSPPLTHSTSNPPTASHPPGHTQDYTPFIRRLVHQSSSLAQNSLHRPTKDELLAASKSWWERLRIRLRWFTIRGWRRFNMDDLSAFASFFVVGNSECARSPI